MKKLLKFVLPVVIFTFLFSGCATNRAISQGSSGDITYQTFYNDLSPYGTWIDYPGYGNVWNPSGIADFTPYSSNGYWVYSNAGWSWNSGYSWGWAPFHYGRWFYDDNYGWLWVPGYDWSPAWVTWGTFGDDYCWAPLLPDVYVGMQFSSWRAPGFYWNFCSRDYIYDRNLSGFIQRGGTHINDVSRISIIDNFDKTRRHNNYYSKGPNVAEVERYTNRKIEPVSMRDVNKSNMVKHEGNSLNVYRPTVQRPQPNQFKSVEPEKIKPILHNEQPSTERHTQEQNIHQLPMQRGEMEPGRGGEGRKR